VHPKLSFEAETFVAVACVVLFLLVFAGSHWVVYWSRGDADLLARSAMLCGHSVAWQVSGPCHGEISR
jgi:hypothetical protein